MIGVAVLLAALPSLHAQPLPSPSAAEATERATARAAASAAAREQRLAERRVALARDVQAAERRA
ncbi:MAG: hypothetical protein K2X49_07895, partial [Acetobacteraceae bacterium]|nr:hypothetical protein [Acetobacteraceae bacterium]